MNIECPLDKDPAQRHGHARGWISNFFSSEPSVKRPGKVYRFGIHESAGFSVRPYFESIDCCLWVASELL